MKSIYSITIILVLTVFFMLSLAECHKSYMKLKSKDSEKKTINDLIKALFSHPENSIECKEGVEKSVITESRSNLPGSSQEGGHLWAVPKSKFDKYTKRLYGWGPSAYLFDYLDPILLKPILNSFNLLWKRAELETFSARPEENIDPYSLQNIFRTQASEESLITRMKTLKPNFDVDLWKSSLTVPKVRRIAQDWPYNSLTNDFAREIVDSYDYNGDGRLSKKEFLIAYLNINRAILGDQDCSTPTEECIHYVVKNYILPMFVRTDCIDSDDKIGAEDMWESLATLIRPIKDYNIFTCFVDNEPYHTVAINDFILKSQKTIDGYLNKLEFIRGILLAYWARHVRHEDMTECTDPPEFKICTHGLGYSEYKNYRWINQGSKCVTNKGDQPSQK